MTQVSAATQIKLGDNMKKRIAVAVLLAALMIFSLCSCSNSNDKIDIEFESNADKILVNMNNDIEIAFNIALFSNDKIDEVKFLQAYGKNIDNISFNAELTDNTPDGVKDNAYKGVYCKYICVELLFEDNAQDSEIEKITLNVDGKKRDISFSTPIKCQFSEGNIFTEQLLALLVANEFSSKIVNNKKEKVRYLFEAEEDLTLNKIYLKDFVDIADISVSVDQGRGKKLELPLHIKKGQTVDISLSFSSEKASNLNYVMTNIFFEYTTDKDKKEYVNSATVSFDPIYPISDNDTLVIEKMIEDLRTR